MALIDRKVIVENVEMKEFLVLLYNVDMGVESYRTISEYSRHCAMIGALEAVQKDYPGFLWTILEAVEVD